MDWRTANLTQARSDFEMLQTLSRQQAPPCHQLHYLQMSTEKLAKGFSTPPMGLSQQRCIALSSIFCAPSGAAHSFAKPATVVQAKLILTSLL